MCGRHARPAWQAAAKLLGGRFLGVDGGLDAILPQKQAELKASDARANDTDTCHGSAPYQ